MDELLAWIARHQEWLALVAGSSLALMLATALLIPITVCRLPADYFTSRRRDASRASTHRPRLWRALVVVKNLVGAIFVLAGLAMLVLPGQGLLTLVLGLALMNFPGKYRLEQGLVRWPVVHRSLNSIRRAAGCAPLIPPPPPEAD